MNKHLPYSLTGDLKFLENLPIFEVTSLAFRQPHVVGRRHSLDSVSLGGIGGGIDERGIGGEGEIGAGLGDGKRIGTEDRGGLRDGRKGAPFHSYRPTFHNSLQG